MLQYSFVNALNRLAYKLKIEKGLSKVITNNEEIYEVLLNAKTIAIVGLSDRKDRASYMVAEFLQDKGYKIIPVNPLKIGSEILGEKVYPNLASVKEHIDIVDVFRKSEALQEVAEDFLKTDAKVFWTQLGIEDDKVFQFITEKDRVSSSSQ